MDRRQPSPGQPVNQQPHLDIGRVGLEVVGAGWEFDALAVGERNE